MNILFKARGAQHASPGAGVVVVALGAGTLHGVQSLHTRAQVNPPESTERRARLATSSGK